jgi:serine protease inhibitor ecotin
VESDYHVEQVLDGMCYNSSGLTFQKVYNRPRTLGSSPGVIEVGGTIKEETIKGWGFPRYIVSKLGPMAGTLMAIDPRAPKVARFIKLGGDPYLIRYNSRLPIVVYVPEGVEVRYRIWTAGEEAKAIEKG